MSCFVFITYYQPLDTLLKHKYNYRNVIQPSPIFSSRSAMILLLLMIFLCITWYNIIKTVTINMPHCRYIKRDKRVMSYIS